MYELQADGFAATAFVINNATGDITQMRPFTEDPARSQVYVVCVSPFAIYFTYHNDLHNNGY